ncbi:uncharacterized protein LOC131004581 [Salvia miltiorrhiza]|uniref:uncharacterized protein LOC131004581 n=1 Tax=Salvia miltiorrhiza TaxID=226208 RepID=UPI0025ABC633|nr:uncharacterized protein LOC131004581 [Salvia miltiorrhiza]
MDREFDDCLEQCGGSLGVPLTQPMMGFAPFSQASNVFGSGNNPTPARLPTVEEEALEAKPKAKGPRPTYTSEETELICILWAEATHNLILGTFQKLLQYWGLIDEKYNALKPPGASRHKPDHIKSHFNRVSKEVRLWMDYYKACHDNWGSGMSDDQIIEATQTMHEAHHKKRFGYIKAWKVLRECQKFTSQATDVHSAKKSKGSDTEATTTSLDPSITTRPQGTKAAKRDKGNGNKGEASSTSTQSSYSEVLEKIAVEMKEHKAQIHGIAKAKKTLAAVKREELDLKILNMDTSKMNEAQLAWHNHLIQEVLKRRGIM